MSRTLPIRTAAASMHGPRPPHGAIVSGSTPATYSTDASGDASIMRRAASSSAATSCCPARKRSRDAESARKTTGAAARCSGVR